MTLFWGIGPCGQIVMSAECRNTLEKVAYYICTISSFTRAVQSACPELVSLAADTVHNIYLLLSSITFLPPTIFYS